MRRHVGRRRDACSGRIVPRSERAREYGPLAVVGAERLAAARVARDGDAAAGPGCRDRMFVEPVVLAATANDVGGVWHGRAGDVDGVDAAGICVVRLYELADRRRAGDCGGCYCGGAAGTGGG